MEIKPNAIMEFEEAQASIKEGIKEAAKGAKVAMDVTKDALAKNKYLQIGIAASFMFEKNSPFSDFANYCSDSSSIDIISPTD